MDGHIKEGQLYMQQHKIVKKWKKTWAVLFADGPHGVARLEVFEGERPGSSDWRSDRKVIRLSECVTVLATPSEAGPQEAMGSFCVRTAQQAYVFATAAQDCPRWVETICQTAFQGRGGGGTDSQQLKMEENLIYESREEARRFWVTVQQTEASERCGLQGAHWLSVDDHALTLSDGHAHNILLAWPYRLLRRYGYDKGMFSVEAGRRCESGPGTFSFVSAQGGQIFACMETAIQQHRVLQEEEPGSSSAPCEPGRQSPGLLEDPSAAYSLPVDCVRQPAPLQPAQPPEPVYCTPLDHIQPPAPSPAPPRPRRGDAPDPQLSEGGERSVCSRPERQGALRGSPKSWSPRGMEEEDHMLTSDPGDPCDPHTLYSQVTKHATPNITWDPDSDDIIYDNLGVI
ncbi:hypothetical protein COCON_G00100550 [Conger conger]|uniref:Docking protein 3 n=1 Tax=Conger conger TaxID=82655 RepID=A0A9Q1HXC1_CONCO|nr:docking protein 1-like [Conger conger]KAJ8271196.1 hypothetical protein COCON_G00100550 [Conger conger]